MRCKLGDLVIVTYSDKAENIGRTGVVTERFNLGEPWTEDWWIEPSNEFYCCDVITFAVKATTGEVGFKDCDLQPIGNPGEHETDEMLLIVQPPQPVEA